MREKCVQRGPLCHVPSQSQGNLSLCMPSTSRRSNSYRAARSTMSCSRSLQTRGGMHMAHSEAFLYQRITLGLVVRLMSSLSSRDPPPLGRCTDRVSRAGREGQGLYRPEHIPGTPTGTCCSFFNPLSSSEQLRSSSEQL